jgi:glutathione-specific gamma-glutamylcyclotransferase
MTTWSSQNTSWLFGYGSLIWRPDFRYLQKQRARIFGYKRVFYQGSPDHRGTPQHPGRVVTLKRAEESSCEGLAFQIDLEEEQRIMAAMDQREIGGYARRQMGALLLESHPGREDQDQGTPIDNLWVYIATERNPHYLGFASPKQIAKEAIGRAGESGTNPEYIFALAKALRELHFEDPHVFAIETALLEFMGPAGETDEPAPEPP